MREMILADDEKSRRAALAKLAPMQRADFVELFEIMQGLPVTIRLLDPPLHEFQPHSEEEIADIAAAMGADPKNLADRARNLHEFNPMLGFRGCRLAIAYPEIAEMQARHLRGGGRSGKAHGQAGGARSDGPAHRHQGRARPGQGEHRRHGAFPSHASPPPRPRSARARRGRRSLRRVVCVPKIRSMRPRSRMLLKGDEGGLVVLSQKIFSR